MYEFVPQIADFDLDTDESMDVPSTTGVHSILENTGATSDPCKAIENLIPLMCSPHDEHKAVCASTKRKYER